MRSRWLGATPVLVALAAIGGALAGAEPSGTTVTDHLLGAGAAAVVALAGTRARRWSMFPLAAAGIALGTTPIGLGCGLVALAVATRANFRRRATPVLGTLVGALGAQGLLRLEVPGFHGVETLVALAAVAPLLASGYRSAPRAERRRARQVTFGVAIVGGTCMALGFLSVAMARTSADRGVMQLQQGVRAARQSESESAADVLARASQSFGSAHDSMASWWSLPARAVPVLGANLREMADAADAASDVADAGADALAESAADELEVRGGAIPIGAFADLEQPLLSVQAALAAAHQRLGPTSPWLVDPVRTRLDRLQDRLGEAQHDADVALTAVRTLPEFFGSGGVRRYLVLFVTPVEGRGSGFPGNFAELTLTDGKMEMTRFGRVLELEHANEDGTIPVDMPEEYEARYARFGTSWRNITLTPDFPTVAELARQMYPQSGGTEIDGVLSVDPSALASLLRLTGPITVPGIRRELTSRNAEEFLLREQYVDLPDTPDRADALESLGRATFDALLDGDLPRPQGIARILHPAFDEQHLRIVSFDEDVGRFFDEVGLTGSLLPVRGDGLVVTTNNAIGNKVDLFLQRTIGYEAEWDPATRTVQSVVSIDLRNDAPSSGLPDYVIGNALNHEDDVPLGTNRTYLSVFTPLQLVSATLGGEPVALESHVEAGRHVYSVFLELGPNGDRATLELTLTGTLPGADGYLLDLAPQVLAQPDLVRIRVRNGARNLIEVDEHPLTARDEISE